MTRRNRYTLDEILRMDQYLMNLISPKSFQKRQIDDEYIEPNLASTPEEMHEEIQESKEEIEEPKKKRVTKKKVVKKKTPRKNENRDKNPRNPKDTK
jgi:hypothetical protein